MGVWIETFDVPERDNLGKSHPSWVCGLKLVKDVYTITTISHTLRGCVD